MLPTGVIDTQHNRTHRDEPFYQKPEQKATRFPATPASTAQHAVVIDEVALLTQTADQTGVYASQGLFGSGETNPLVITFAGPVSNFSVFVANGEDVRNYTVSDNLGDSVTMSLASAGGFGAGTFALTGNGITTVKITSANADGWDFAIDNVVFTEAAPVPEPRSLLLACAGFILLLGVARMAHYSRSRTNALSSAAFRSETAQ